MTDVTVIMAYYENPGMLHEQFSKFRALPQNIRDHLQLIVVDDGSPKYPAVAEKIGMPLQLYRVGIDVRWNQDACRNIGVHHAATEWVLMTDMDHLVPEATISHIITRKWGGDKVYKFSRVSAPHMTHYKPHPNSWLMTRLMFNRIGGYDERLSGWYGTDADFRRQVELYAQIITLKEVLIRVPREVIPDASTTTYLRKQEEDRENLKRLRKQISKIPNARPKTLTFPYIRVA